MSRASQIIVLCEDKAHECFVYRFLSCLKVNKRNIRIVPYPVGEGDAKRHVLSQIPQQATIVARRSAKTILIVVMDADNRDVTLLHRELDSTLQNNSLRKHIAYIIPKWSIETWLAYLDGNDAVDEADGKTYKDRYAKRAVSKEAHPLIDALAERCHNQIPLQAPPQSLELACAEFSNLRPTL